MSARAVLDPNVIVSAALSPDGTPAVLLRTWLEGGYELVVSPALLAEIERVLRYPKIAKRVSAAEAVELLALLRSQAMLLSDPDRPPSVHSPDPNDDYLVCLAEAAGAALVSGDTDIQCLATAIPAYSPTSFAAVLGIVR
jgi:putative PIN family toxin of toxin-antitoxin system